MSLDGKRPAAPPEPPVPLDPLPRRLDPPARLEDRLVHELRREGLIQAGTGRWSRPWLVAAVAAGLALFAGGFAAGQYAGGRSIAETVAALEVVDAARRAEVIQRTGSLYVRAMTALNDPTPEDPGLEVALATLRAAAAELVRLEPDDARLRHVLALLEGQETGAAEGSAVRSVLWF